MATLKIKDSDGVVQYLSVEGAGTVGDPFVPCNHVLANGAVDNYFSDFAKDLADSNNENGNKNYSVTPGVFTLAPGAGETLYVSRLVIFIRDTGAFDADKYGNNITLTNGIKMEIKRDGVVQATLTNAQPITSNSHWSKFCFDTDLSSYGTGDESLSARWTFTKAGTYIKLEDAETDTIEITLNDDFSGLVEHTFLLQGYKA